MGSSGSMRAQIGTLIIATSGVQLANGFLAGGDREFRGDHGRSRPQQLFRRLHVGRVALRTDHRAGWAHPRLRRLRWDGGRGDRDDALLLGPLSWLVLRAVVGFGCARLFITTESWLNAKAQPAERGRIFSIYMVGTFLALALGQLLIGPAEIETAGPFNAIVALFAVALVMVSTTRAEPPRLTAAATPPYGELARAAPVAVVGGALSGLIGSSFYALVPAWMQDEGIARETIAMSMLVAVLGGLAFQVPIGRLSDRFDRRIVLAALGLGFAGAAVALVLLDIDEARKVKSR
jgi:MFS family permease